MDNLKVLIILDNNYMNERSADDFRALEDTINNAMSQNSIDAKIEELAVDFDYDVCPEYIMKKVDE